MRQLTDAELDLAAARLELLEREAALVRQDLRDQILLYGLRNRELLARVFRFTAQGKKLNVARVRR